MRPTRAGLLLALDVGVQSHDHGGIECPLCARRLDWPPGPPLPGEICQHTELPVRAWLGDHPAPDPWFPDERADVPPSRPATASDAPVTTANPKDVVGSSKAPLACASAAVTAEVGVAMLEGSLKYGRHNYREAPIRASVYFDAVSRHMRSWWEEGQDLDPDSNMHHITKAIATLYVLRDSMITGQWDDDRPPPVPAGFFAELDAKAAALVAKYPAPKRPVRADGK